MKSLLTILALSVLLGGALYGQAQEPRHDGKTVTGLTEKLRDNDVAVRRSAAEALLKFGPEAKQAIPSLIKALEDTDRLVRRRAVECLDRMGSEASKAIPALTRVLQDEDKYTRQCAARALWQIRRSAGAARPTNVFPHGEVKDGLAAFVECHGSQFKVGQAIPVDFGIILVGDGLGLESDAMSKLQLSVWRPFHPVDPLNVSYFQVTRSDGQEVSYLGPAVDFPNTLPLDKNSVVLHHREIVGMVYPDLCEEFDLNKPGTYKVRWGYAPFFRGRPWTGKLMSNEFQLEIVGDDSTEAVHQMPSTTHDGHD